MTEKPFVKVTVSNKDIYEMIQRNHADNKAQHEAIIKRLDQTNGKVKLARWIGTTALAIAILAIGYLFQHINK